MSSSELESNLHMEDALEEHSLLIHYPTSSYESPHIWPQSAPISQPPQDIHNTQPAEGVTEGQQGTALTELPGFAATPASPAVIPETTPATAAAAQMTAAPVAEADEAASLGHPAAAAGQVPAGALAGVTAAVPCAETAAAAAAAAAATQPVVPPAQPVLQPQPLQAVAISAAGLMALPMTLPQPQLPGHPVLPAAVLGASDAGFLPQWSQLQQQGFLYHQQQGFQLHQVHQQHQQSLAQATGMMPGLGAGNAATALTEPAVVEAPTSGHAAAGASRSPPQATSALDQIFAANSITGSGYAPAPSAATVAAPHSASLSVLTPPTWQQQLQMQLLWTTQPQMHVPWSTQQQQMLANRPVSAIHHNSAPMVSPQVAAAQAAAQAAIQRRLPQQQPPRQVRSSAAGPGSGLAAAAAAAAGAGPQQSDTVKWTDDPYTRELAEQDRLRGQQQDLGSARPAGDSRRASAAAAAAGLLDTRSASAASAAAAGSPDTGSASSAAAAAPAPAAAADSPDTRSASAAAAAPSGAKKRKNNRRNMRKVGRQTAGADGGDSSDGDGSSDGNDNSNGEGNNDGDGRRAGGDKASRKRGPGRPSLIHRRMMLVRKIKAILLWRGWLLWNTLVAVTGDSAGNPNTTAVDAFFYAVFGPHGYMWPQEQELAHEAVEDNLYIARLLSSLTGSFVHPSDVAALFKHKKKGKTEVNQTYLANKGLNPDTWTLPLPEEPLAQLAAQQTTDQEMQAPQPSAAGIHAVEDRAAEALLHYNAPAAARLTYGLQRLRADENKSDTVLPPTGYLRRHALEETIIAAGQHRRDPAAAAAAAAGLVVQHSPEAATPVDLAALELQQLPLAAVPHPPRRRRRARQEDLHESGADTATVTTSESAAATETATVGTQP